MNWIFKYFKSYKTLFVLNCINFLFVSLYLAFNREYQIIDYLQFGIVFMAGVSFALAAFTFMFERYHE